MVPSVIGSSYCLAGAVVGDGQRVGHRLAGLAAGARTSGRPARPVASQSSASVVVAVRRPAVAGHAVRARRPSARGRAAGSARCRTAASAARPDGAGTRRTPPVAPSDPFYVSVSRCAGSGRACIGGLDHVPSAWQPCAAGRVRRGRPLAVVADVAGRHHEDDVLGDVGGVVADALEVARDQDQVERRLDGAAGSCSM